MSNVSKRLVLVMDIPTPYRLHLFNALHDELTAAGIAFEVLFMARSVPMRFLHFDETRCRFPYVIAPGIHLRWSDSVFHFNARIVWSVLKKPPTWLILGGSWNMPTVAVVLLARFLRPVRSYTVLWAEANERSIRFKRGVVAGLRNMLVRSADAYLIPGRIAERAVGEHWRVNGRPLLPLPNLVDECRFRDSVSALRRRRRELRSSRGVGDEELVLLWPARLHEETKGIVNFLSAVKELVSPRLKILIAGGGPDRQMITEWLEHSSLRGVFLLGQQSEDKMVELYACGDILLLPSIRDANPLVVIEGLWSGLPLFVSSSCGNWPEALEEGANGWLVDSSSPESMRSAFADMLGRSQEDLECLGRRSLAIASERFSTARCVNAFVQQLQALA